MNNWTRQRAIELIATCGNLNNLLNTFSIILNHTRILPGFDRELEALLKHEFIKIVDALVIEAKEKKVRERVRNDILNFRAVRKSVHKNVFLEAKRVCGEQWHSAQSTYILDRCAWISDETYSRYGIKEFYRIEDLLTSIDIYGNWHEWYVIEPENASYRNRQEVNQENE